MLESFQIENAETLQLVSDESQRDDHAKTNDPAHDFRYKRVETCQDECPTKQRRPDVTRGKDERWVATLDLGASTCVWINRDLQYRTASENSLKKATEALRNGGH